MPLDGEENLRPTAGSRYSSLPSRDGEKRRLTRNFSVIRSFALSLAAHFITRSRPRGKEPTDRRRRGEVTTITEEETSRLLPPRLPYLERGRWCVACRAFMCAVR